MSGRSASTQAAANANSPARSRCFAGPRLAAGIALAMLSPGFAAAQTSGAADCAARSPAAAEAVKRRAVVALYYELKLALSSGRVYEWRAGARPRLVMSNATHVAVDAGHGHAIDADNRVLRWVAGSDKTEFVFDDAAFAAAGESGLLAIRCDGSLWQRKAGAPAWSRVAGAAIHAWVGDSADYYIDPRGRLYATGKAHRGQYGNGHLDEAGGWVVVAEDAVSVYSHTGHAVYLRVYRQCRGRDDGYPSPPAQIRTGRIAAYGSCLR